MPAVLDFVKFGFNLEKYEKKVSTIFSVEIISFKKRLYHQHNQSKGSYNDRLSFNLSFQFYKKK